MKGHFKSSKCKVLDQPDVKDTLHKLHAIYVLVPADKAANNVIIVCKKYYIDTLVKELGINNVNINNPTYIPIDDSFETIMKSHNQFIKSVGLEISEEDQNLPYLYWTPKLHKSPYKHRFIAGSSKCTTKDLSGLLTKVLSTINKTNDLILILTPENVTQHSRIVTTTRKGSSTPTKMSKIIGRQIH